jgi:hypothetical protein
MVSRMTSVDEALQEISAIERLIKPFESYTPDVKRVLDDLATLRSTIEKMDKVGIKQAVERISSLETEVTPYRGIDVVDEALQHAQKLRSLLEDLT